jgi:hypothetical protein
MVIVIVLAVWVGLSIPVALLLGVLFAAERSQSSPREAAPPPNPEMTRTGTG